MFILSQAIIPVFVFAVLVNFYHFNSILSIEVAENFTDCQSCSGSKCHTDHKGPCSLLPDNITVQCFSCPVEKTNKQFFSEQECQSNCSVPTKCLCNGKCFMCVEDETTVDTASFTCGMPPLFEWSEDCSVVTAYKPPPFTS